MCFFSFDLFTYTLTYTHRVESKEAQLRKMLETVLKDKEKIQGTIDKLDDYKVETLERTWRQVNDDFGRIFGDLLPDSGARLDVPEGSRFADGLGLEIKVRLGQSWKASLQELSGGQRSLVALALILALLRGKKPAPFYILDEVDAALDPSHTQNIGRVLREHAKGSQFIVVSLKEGMWGWARVLFRTTFKDGISCVEREGNNLDGLEDSGNKVKKNKKKMIEPNVKQVAA